MNDSDIKKRLYELENKQKMLVIGMYRAMEKLGIQEDDNLELFCVSSWSYESFEKFKSFLVESSIMLHNEKLSKVQFIDNYNNLFSDKKLLLPKLMEIVDKTDEFEHIRNLYFDRK